MKRSDDTSPPGAKKVPFLPTVQVLSLEYRPSVEGEGNLRPRRPPREYLGEYTS